MYIMFAMLCTWVQIKWFCFIKVSYFINKTYIFSTSTSVNGLQKAATGHPFGLPLHVISARRFSLFTKFYFCAFRFDICFCYFRFFFALSGRVFPTIRPCVLPSSVTFDRNRVS